MKTLPVFIIIAAILLMACENNITSQTKVNEDGSLDKVIVFEKANENVAESNIFGINSTNGWSLAKTKPFDSATTQSDKEQVRLKFARHFASDTKMNDVLDKNVDTLFRIHATFQKKFRWFYTYIQYSETIKSANRFKEVYPQDYFTAEDSAFIKRLPAEGKPISKADSVSLLLLNEKIFDHFMKMGITLETYKILQQVIKRNELGNQWLDTLMRKREVIYKLIDKDLGEQDFVEKIANELKLPLAKEKAGADIRALSKDLNSRLAFMGFVRDGKFIFEFEMPWAVVHTNADSVSANKLYWKPVVHKFAFMDYTMQAESRTMNVWAIVVSFVIIGGTLFGLRGKFAGTSKN